METKIETSFVEDLKKIYEIMDMPIGENFESEANDIMLVWRKGIECTKRAMRIVALQTKLSVAYFQQSMCHPKKKPRKINRLRRKIKALQEVGDNERTK